MSFSRTFDVCQQIYESIVDISQWVYNFLGRQFAIPGVGTFSVFELMFGAGVIAIIIWLFVKFLLPT